MLLPIISRVPLPALLAFDFSNCLMNTQKKDPVKKPDLFFATGTQRAGGRFSI
jgi:hypothetical protein